MHDTNMSTMLYILATVIFALVAFGASLDDVALLPAGLATLALAHAVR